MDTVAGRINDCRGLYREGRYRQAIVVARRALDEIDGNGPLAADASDVEYGLDAAARLPARPSVHRAAAERRDRDPRPALGDHGLACRPSGRERLGAADSSAPCAWP